MIIVILILIAVIIIFILNFIKKNDPMIIIQTPSSVSIINKSGNSALKKYNNIWKYDSTEADYYLYLNDNITQINYDESLNKIISLAGNSKYILFKNSSSYIIKSNCNLPDTSNISYDNNILNEGYPQIFEEGVILHNAYLKEIFENIDLPFSVPNTIPSIINPRIKYNSVTKIPKIIHQTFQTNAIPNGMYQAIHTWVNHNPEYEYKYYSEYDRRQFIQNHFDKNVLEAYDSLIPAAYRADLFRYCVIYIEGGIYIDIKMSSLLPLRNIINDDTTMVVVNDTLNGAILNGFFAATSKHPAIKNLIDLVVERIINKDYGNHILYPTGPMAMGTTLLSYFNKKLPNGITKTENDIVQVYSHRNKAINGENNVYIVNLQDENLVKFCHKNSNNENYIRKITGLPHYRHLYKKRMVFN